MICAQVVGAVLTRSLRYQSSCALVFSGTAYSVPWYSADWAAIGSTSWSAVARFAPVIGLSQPAAANSAVQIVSMLSSEKSESCAARRWTASWREASELFASGVIVMS